jgi:DHA2 family multidrug resistance protein
VTATLPAFMDPSTGFGLQALNGEITRQGAMIGYDWVFGLILVVTLGLFPLLLILRPPPPMAPALRPEAAHE